MSRGGDKFAILPRMYQIDPYDLYVTGLLNDLSRAQAAKPVDTNAINQAFRNLEELQKSMESILKATSAAGGRLKSFYVVASPVVTAYHTVAPVDTKYPECGAANPTLDDIYTEVSTALKVASAAVRAIPVYGTVASLVAKVASLAVSIFGQRHQSHASCVDTIALVPGCLGLKDLDIQVWVGRNQNPLANPKIDALHDNWWGYKHVDVPELSLKTVSVMVPSTDPKYNAGLPCEFRILRVRLRNWSDNENLQLYFKAYWDAPMTGCSHCSDFGMMSENPGLGLLIDLADETVIGRLNRYFNDLLKQNQEYTREYKKDPHH
jgi:hypothetical protein